MIMLPNGEKEELTMCVVLIVHQQEGPWRWKHARYLDGLEQLQSWLCENTYLTQLCTHQRFIRLHASFSPFGNIIIEACRREERWWVQRWVHECSCITNFATAPGRLDIACVSDDMVPPPGD